MAWVMSTLGFGVILQSIGLAIWGPSQVVVPGPVGDEVIRIVGVGVRPQEILMLGVAVVIMSAFDWVMSRTMVGKAMRAVAQPTRREPDGHQHQRRDDRRLRPQLGARRPVGFLLAPIAPLRSSWA